MKLVSAIIVAILSPGWGSSLSEEIGESFPRVVTPLGPIEGYYKTASNGRRYEAYEGIPYAQPPTGESRFGVPGRISPWTGVLMAKQFGPRCMQYDSFASDPSQNVKGSEDCLYANIYTPSAGDDRGGVNGGRINLLPVIFFIHGGAFQVGNVANYKSEYLLDNNVTLVTINYRLGPLGFLSTEDATVPGNMGLKDQVIALQWVKDNVESFGGDPSRITIFGQSAGGASVHYHYLSNLTTGLFTGGMSLSGTALNCWAQTENPLQTAKKLATIVGCPIDNVQRMVNCLRARPAHQIVRAVGRLMMWMSYPVIQFGPVIEKGGGNFTFIDQPPVDIIISGRAHDVPWITGVTSEEGLLFVAAFTASDKVFQELNDNWETIAPYLLDFDNTVPKTDHPRVSRLIKRHYLGTSPFSRSTINETVQAIGDRFFVYGAEEAARLHARGNQSPVRFYDFSYRGAHSLSELLSRSDENFGVCHTDDGSYVLGSYFDPTTTPRDREMQKKLIDLWVSFATDGTPDVGVEWPEVSRSTDEFSYLHIADPGEISIEETPLKIGEKNFWRTVGFHENIYNNYTIR